MPALPRLLRVMLYGAIAVAVVAPAAAANAAPSAKDLQQQVDQANANFEKIVEQYNGVGERLKATQAEADALTAKMAPLQSQMDAAYASVGEIAVRAYKGGAMTPMAALLSGSPSAGLIDELTSLDHLARVRQADIDAFTRTKTQFDDQRKALENLLNTERTDQKNLADQKAKIEADLVNLTALQKKAAAATGSSGTSGSGTSKAPPAAPNIGGGAGTAVRFAYGALGKPYVFAAAGPSSFDCSGLTMAAWRAAGRSLPHNAAMQWSAVAHISSSQLQPGDLVFYSGLSHVAIYIGSGSVIHAPHTGTVVQVASVNMMTPYGYGRVR